jgi:S-DNA-T family DNA segregation ATPase FtsK/SpoIIIE
MQRGGCARPAEVRKTSLGLTMAKKTKGEESASAARPTLLYIGWAVLAGAWMLLLAAMISYDAADPPNPAIYPHNTPPRNWVGAFGGLLAYKAYAVIGPGVWVALGGAAFYLGAVVLGRRVNQVFIRGLGLAIMTVAASCLIALGMPSLVAGLGDRPEGPGGLLAIYVNNQLIDRFNVPGTLVILAVSFWIGAILTVDQIVLAIPRMIGEAVLRLADVKLPAMPRLRGRLPVPTLAGVGAAFSGWWAAGDGRATATADARRKPLPVRTSKRRGRDEDDEDPEAIDEDAGGLGGTESFDPARHRAHAPDDEDEDEEVHAAVDDDDEQESDDEAERDAPGAYVSSKKEFNPDDLRKKMAQLPINFAPKLQAKRTEAPRQPDYSGYQFPGFDLLEEPEGNFTAEQERICREQAVSLEEALQQYRIDGEVVGIDSGPVITLFEVRLAPGTKVAALNSVDSDLARALKAQNIRIVPNMAGKDTVGIEVPNLKKERVRMKELMTAAKDDVAKMKLPMFLGKDASGNPLIQDLNAMPHMLIAGTTGSGKSVCMNSIIMSFLYTKKPDELKLVLVDPKMVEMSLFKDIPHLMCPVVTEMSKAAAILEWAVTKMDERYELLAEVGVRDIASYNELGEDGLRERLEPITEEELVRIPKKLPYMVFVIDELADLMMTNKEVEGSIVRIAQKARAVGIHLILATQRPQANVVTGLIKSNMPCRIAMKVASGMDSRIVLDQKGGELLLGHGDMLFLSPRSSKLTRAQGCLVDDIEIRRTVKFLKEVAEQNFEPQLVQLRGPGAGEGELSEKDELFDQAVEVLLETQRGSVSLLQRRLAIGYSRASRLIEQMAEYGILGSYKGSQAREVLIGKDEWEAMKAQAQADAAAHAGVETHAAETDEAFDQDDEDDDSVPDEFDNEYRN